MTKKREDFANELKWDLQSLFKNEEEFNNKYQELKSKLTTYSTFKTHILDNANSLYTFLDFDTAFSRDLERIYIYAHLQNDADTTNTKYQTLFGISYNLYENYCQATSYVVPEILKSNILTIEEFIKQEPKLQAYERALKEIFRYQEFTLSDKEESILSNLTSVFKTSDDVYSLLTDADLKFGKIKGEDGNLIELTEKTYHKLIASENRNVRKNAFKHLFNGYSKFKNTYASLLASEIIKNNRLANIRGYKSALVSSLYHNNIPINVYETLINTVKNNTEPLSRFWDLKRKSLGITKLHIYDTYAPITKEVNLKYTEEEAKKIILSSLNVLGDTYINDLKKSFSEHWIDFVPNDGKRNGAYCTACYDTHPYVLLSFDGTLNSVSTLIHELGHAMHYYYAINNQNYQDYEYSIFVAEVASQVNQILLSKYLINKTEDIETKKYLIDDLIKDFKAAIYRQTMFADFEYTIHEKEAKGEVLTHEVLCNLYYDLNKEYNGKNIVLDDEVRYEWMRIPHFYMNFYVYQYATAYAASIKIAMDILDNKSNAKENYLEFLKLGCTKTPIESLKIAGVDMTKKETLEEAFTYFSNLVSELESLYEGGVK